MNGRTMKRILLVEPAASASRRSRNIIRSLLDLVQEVSTLPLSGATFEAQLLPLHCH
jgi:hypothetical protein